MERSNCDIRIGTSGWHYNHWKGLFYPAELAKSEWFGYYAKGFDTVEINNTFYQLPKQETFKNWHKQAPKNFLYTVKANRYITHIKRLKDTSEPLERFFERVSILGGKLGPILYQLPPNLHKDLDLLGAFIKLLPGKLLAVFEFRHESWFSQDTFDLLNQSGVGFCIHDLAGIPTPRIITGNIIYVRFHGPTGKYEGNYSKSALQDWAQWIKENTKQTQGIYVYFNNDIHANAVHNAKQLKEQLL